MNIFLKEMIILQRPKVLLRALWRQEELGNLLSFPRLLHRFNFFGIFIDLFIILSWSSIYWRRIFGWNGSVNVFGRLSSNFVMSLIVFFL